MTEFLTKKEKTFEDYHGSGFFSARLSKMAPPEQTFLPFWVVSATVHSTIEQAQVVIQKTKKYKNRWISDNHW